MSHSHTTLSHITLTHHTVTCHTVTLSHITITSYSHITLTCHTVTLSYITLPHVTVTHHTITCHTVTHHTTTVTLSHAHLRSSPFLTALPLLCITVNQIIKCSQPPLDKLGKGPSHSQNFSYVLIQHTV